MIKYIRSWTKPNTTLKFYQDLNLPEWVKFENAVNLMVKDTRVDKIDTTVDNQQLTLTKIYSCQDLSVIADIENLYTQALIEEYNAFCISEYGKLTKSTRQLQNFDHGFTACIQYYFDNTNNAKSMAMNFFLSPTFHGYSNIQNMTFKENLLEVIFQYQSIDEFNTSPYKVFQFINLEFTGITYSKRIITLTPI